MAFDRVAAFMVSSQEELERLYAKNQLMPRLKAEFDTPSNRSYMARAGLHAEFSIDLLAHMALLKRAMPEALIGTLKHHFDGAELDPFQLAADELMAAAFADLVHLRDRVIEDPLTGERMTKLEVIVAHDISPEVQMELDRFQYPLPMVEAPEPVTNNRQTGYQTIKGSLLLKNNHHEGDLALDHINRMNHTPLRINADAAMFVQNHWKNLDRQKEDETFLEFKQRKDAFRKFDEVARDIVAAFAMDNQTLYLTHRYDKRGRTYAQGHHINYQGNDWCKASIEFANGEVLNDF